MCLQERLHLPDIGFFTIQKLLGQNPDLRIFFRKPVQLPQRADHAFGIHADQNIRDAGIVISAAELHSGHSVSEKPEKSIHFRKFPSTLQSDAAGFRFQSIVFPKLLLQNAAQLRMNGSIQQTADAYLAPLCGFMDRRQKGLILIHLVSPWLVCTFPRSKYIT